MQPRDQLNSSKSADGAQQLALASSIILYRRYSLGISSTQANQPTEPSSSHWRAQSFYTGHTAYGSAQLRQISRRSPTARIGQLNHSAQVTLPKKSDQTACISELNHSTQAMQPRDQLNSGKSADGAQQLALVSSIILHRPYILGISSTQANQPTEPNSSHWRAQSFYIGHAA